MNVELNHTIVPSTRKVEASTWLAQLLGLPPPKAVSHFMAIELGNGVTLDYDDAETVERHHYAFLVADDAEFDAIFARVQEAGITYFADPYHHRPGETNTRNGGRGFYFEDPDGHNLEVFTKPPIEI